MFKQSKRIFKIMIVAMMTSLVMMMFSCSAASDELTSTATEQKTEEKVVYYENASLPLAKLAAETYLLQYETINNCENATLDEPYPLYNPATDVVTYLEYPVIKDGKRKGYIMVTLKDDEPSVVEASENSEMTNYEALAEKAGTDDIKAVRFSFAAFTAEDTTVSRSGCRRVLAALGDIENEIEIGEVTRSVGSAYEDYINAYKARVEENDGFLDINKDVYEENKEWIESHNGNISRGNISKYDKSQIVTKLSNYSNIFPTMILNQFKVKFLNGEVGDSGCVPTAGAIAIAYYARRFNCKKLFGGELPPDVKIFPSNRTIIEGDNAVSDVVLDLRKRLFMEDNSSRTSLLPNAITQYMKENGLPVAVHSYKYTGRSWNCIGLDALKRSLDRDDPAFLSYNINNDSDRGHCVVIYKVSIQRDWAGNYKECTYYVNMGWGYGELYNKSISTWNTDINYLSIINLQEI